MDARETELAAIARRQHSVWHRDQALGAGLPEWVIDHRVATRAWSVDAPGVYGAIGAPYTWHRRLMTAQLDVGPHSVIYRRAAVALHGFRDQRPCAPELLVPKGTTGITRWRVHETRYLPAGDCTTRYGIPVTTPVRTLLDMASVLRGDALEALVDGALADRAVNLGDLTARYAAWRRRGRRGSAAFGRVIEARAPGYVPPASALEALLFAVLAAGGLPPPERQRDHPGTGVVDAAYTRARVIIEVDGRRWHSREQDMARDRRRDIEAGLRGYVTLRFMWGDLVREPEWVCSVVRQHLVRAAAA